MANTFMAISTATVGSGGAANMEFTSIPATFTDLSIFISSRSTTSGDIDNFKIYFNGANSDRSSKFLLGRPGVPSVTSVTLSTSQTGFTNGDTATASTFGSAFYYIPNYAGATVKAFSGDSASEFNTASTQLGIDANLWNITSAITSIVISPQSGANWKEFTTATLYGIKSS